MDEGWREATNHGRKWHHRPRIDAQVIQARDAETRRGRARRLLMGVLASWLLLLLMALLCAYWLLLYMPETAIRQAALPLDSAGVALQEDRSGASATTLAPPPGQG